MKQNLFKKTLNLYSVELFLILSAFVTTIKVQENYYRLPTDIILAFSILFVFFVKQRNGQGLVLVSPTLAAILVHFLIVTNLNSDVNLDIASSLEWFLKYFFLSGIFLLAAVHSRSDIIVKAFKKVGFYIINIAFGFELISIVTGFDIGVDRVILPRPQGTLSEPAHLAFLLPGYIVVSIIDREWKKAFFALSLAILSQSPTVYLALFITIYLFTYRNRPIFEKAIITLVGSCSLLIFSISSRDVDDLLNSGDPFLNSIGRLIAGFMHFDDSSFANVRGTMIRSTIEIMREHGYMIFGAGLGSNIPLSNVYNEGKGLDPTIWAAFFVWFGGFGIIFLLFYILFVFLKRRGDVRLGWILVGSSSAGFINSGGAFMQFFIAAISIIYLRSSDFNTQPASQVSNQTK